jgi:AcrR family transcriptional regulator
MNVPVVDDRRRRILDAAAAVLTQNPRASLAEVAAEAGMGRTTVHRYFAARDDLLTALADDALSAVERAVAGTRPDQGRAPDALRRIAEAVLPLADRFRYLEQGPDMWGLDDLDDRWFCLADVVDGIVDRGKRAGEIRGDVPTAVLTEAFAGALWALGEAVNDGRVAPADAAPGLMAVLLHGLGSSPSRP